MGFRLSIKIKYQAEKLISIKENDLITCKKKWTQKIFFYFWFVDSLIVYAGPIDALLPLILPSSFSFSGILTSAFIGTSTAWPI